MTKNCECIKSLILGAILGVIVGYFVYTTTIVGIVSALWISFGIGIGSLVLLTMLSLFTNCENKRCICKSGECLALAAFGTIITSIIALSITIITESIIIAVLIGLLTLFLIVTLYTLLKIVICLTKCN